MVLGSETQNLRGTISKIFQQTNIIMVLGSETQNLRSLKLWYLTRQLVRLWLMLCRSRKH